MPQKITAAPDGTLNVPDEPIIPFIRGDGTGVDIWPATQLVLDAAVAKLGKRVEWLEVLAGQKAFDETGSWLPEETVASFREHVVGIKGPLTTPVGGGIRSLNVALRQMLDLYVCLRPVRWFKGVPSPVRDPAAVDMVIFRENCEDIYAGIEFKAGKNVRFPETSGFGIKPVSKDGTERLVKAAIEYALKEKRPSVNIVHKGN